jgi:hypothetical protein
LRLIHGHLLGIHREVEDVGDLFNEEYPLRGYIYEVKEPLDIHVILSKRREKREERRE